MEAVVCSLTSMADVSPWFIGIRVRGAIDLWRKSYISAVDVLFVRLVCLGDIESAS